MVSRFLPIVSVSTLTLTDFTNVSENDILVGVFGKAGHHPYYNRDMICQLGLVIFEANFGRVRIVGVSHDMNTSIAYLIFVILTGFRACSPLGTETAGTSAKRSTRRMS